MPLQRTACGVSPLIFTIQFKANRGLVDFPPIFLRLKRNAMKIKNKVIHVEFADSHLQPTSENPEGKHFYFGSIAAIFETESFDSSKIGTSRQMLYKAKISNERPFKNGCVTIREGILDRKPTGRKNPVRILRVI